MFCKVWLKNLTEILKLIVPETQNKNCLQVKTSADILFTIIGWLYHLYINRVFL